MATMPQKRYRELFGPDPDHLLVKVRQFRQRQERGVLDQRRGRWCGTDGSRKKVSMGQLAGVGGLGLPPFADFQPKPH
jgi:hypothetical protein